MAQLKEAFEKYEAFVEEHKTDDVIFVAKDIGRVGGAKTYHWTKLADIDYTEYEVVIPDQPCHFYARAEIKDFDHFTNQEYLLRMLEVICMVWNSTFQEKINALMFKVYTDDHSIFHFVLPHFAMSQLAILDFMREVEMACYKLPQRPRLVQKERSTVFDMEIYGRHYCMPMCQSERKKRRMRVLEEMGDSKDFRKYLVQPREPLPSPTKLNQSNEEELVGEYENWSTDETNADELLRSVPIFLLDKQNLIEFLVQAKRAAILDVNMEHLLVFRFGRRVRCPWMVFYKALTVDPSQYSLKGLLNFLNTIGVVVSELAQTPEMFEFARRFEQIQGTPIHDYSLDTGRAKPIDVKNTDLFPHQSFLAVSPMGSGKTYQQLKLVQDLLAADPDTSVIILSCRQLMAKDIERRYKEVVPDIENYLTLKADNKYSQAVRKINLAKKLIIQLESLHLIDTSKDMLNHRRKKMLLIVDEAETVFAQFISRTMDRHYRTTWNTFRALVDHATVTLFGEAVPSVRTYFLCRELCPEIIIERNVAPRVTGAVQRTAVKYDCYAELVKAIERKLRMGKRCGIFCSSLAVGQKLYDIFKTGFRCQFYSSKDRTAHHEFQDLHQHWDKYDVTIWTSVVTVGVSYDLAHFDFMAAFIGCGGPYIRDCIQAVHRIRNLTDNELLWAANGPFSKQKKEDGGGGDGADDESMAASEENEDEPDDRLVFFESGNVMCKLLDERNSKLDRDFADKVDASDPMIRKLVFYEYYEKSLQKHNRLAGLLFGYFLQWYLNYKCEMGQESMNDESGQDKVTFDFSQLRFRHSEIPDEEEHGSILHRDMFTADWYSCISVVLGDEIVHSFVDPETDEVTTLKMFRKIFEQSLADSSNDNLSEDRETLVYRQEIKQIHRMLGWLAMHPFIDISNTKFMTAVWEDFRREHRTWTRFMQVMAEDSDHDLAIHNAVVEQKMRTQNERSLASDASLNYLRVRWELQMICQVLSSYETGPELTEEQLKPQAARIHACYNTLMGPNRMYKYQAQNLRLMLSRMISQLDIGVRLMSERVNRGGNKIMICYWKPDEHALEGAAMAQGHVSIKEARDQTLPLVLARRDREAGAATKKKRGRPRKDKGKTEVPKSD